MFDISKGSGSFIFENRELFYTIKREVLIDKLSKSLSIEYIKNEDFMIGNHTVTLYTDTVQKIQDTDGSFDTITLTTDFEIARDTRVARYFAGSMDVFRIYNRALSTPEIKHNFNVQRHRFGI